MTDTQQAFGFPEEKKRILLVEDELVNQQILTMQLSDYYEIIPAATGAEALELLASLHETLSLVLLDLNLPDIHGLEILKKIKSDPEYAGLPVIVMTADSEAEV